MGSGSVRERIEVAILLARLAQDSGGQVIFVPVGARVPPRWRRQLLVVEGPLSCRQRRRAVVHLRRVFGKLTFHLNQDNARRAGLHFSEELTSQASVLVRRGRRRLQF